MLYILDMKKLLILSITFIFLGLVTPLITEASFNGYDSGYAFSNYGYNRGGGYGFYEYNQPRYYGYQYYYPNYGSYYYNSYGRDYAFSGGYQNFWWY
jgi:hypothetical protein